MDRDSKRLRIPFYRRRISLFFLIFSAFLGVVFVSSSSQLLLFKFSVNSSLDRWKIDREMRLEKEAIDYIKNGVRPRSHEALVIFNTRKEIIFTNRMRHMMLPRDMKPVKDPSGIIVGYISSKPMGFRGLEENKILIDSLLRNLMYSSVVSLILSLIVSYIISKRISKSSIDIQKALKCIEKGNSLDLIPSGAREIIEIGEGVNNLAHKLSLERDLRNQWLHDISHDLKTPVSALKLQFEGILEGILPLNRDRMQQNSKEIERLSSLIEGIDDLMKMESPDIELNKEPFEIRHFLKDLENSFKDIFKIKDRTLQTSYDSGIINGDYSLLFKAVSNLLDNSIQYSQKGSLIKLDITQTAISIENTGETISASDLDHIFDRLYRGDSSRNSNGSGLGLSIVKAIVDKHRGTIEVSSKNGVTRFIISI